MTVLEMKEAFDFFKEKSEASIFNFFKTRGVKGVERGKKRVKGLGTAPMLFDSEQVLKAWENNPITKNRYCKKGAEKRQYNKNNMDTELGAKQPYRAIDDCVHYYDCLVKSARSNKQLKCKGCKSYKKKEDNYYGKKS